MSVSDGLGLHKALFSLLEAISSEAPRPLTSSVFSLSTATVFF